MWLIHWDNRVVNGLIHPTYIFIPPFHSMYFAPSPCCQVKLAPFCSLWDQLTPGNEIVFYRFSSQQPQQNRSCELCPFQSDYHVSFFPSLASFLTSVLPTRKGQLKPKGFKSQSIKVMVQGLEYNIPSSLLSVHLVTIFSQLDEHP